MVTLRSWYPRETLDERLCPHPCLSRVQKGACRYPGSPFVCLPWTPPPPPKLVRERLSPRSSLFRGAASSFVPPDRARCSGGWHEKCPLPSPGRAHGQKDGTPSGPGCSHPQCALDPQAPGPSVRGGRGQNHLYTCGVLAASHPLLAPPPSRSARPVQGASHDARCPGRGR